MALFDAFTGKSAKDAAAKNAELYQQYGGQSTAALDKGFAGASDAIHSGIDAYAPLSDLGKQYGAAPTMLLDSLGVNGQVGSDAATAAFHASPGFKWKVDQAVDAVGRSGVARGVATGNTLAGITDRASNLADQEYGNWQTQLGSFTSPTLAATGGAATGTANEWNTLGNLFQTDAQNRVGVYGNVASGTANSNNQSAQAEMNASSNFWGGLMNLGGNIATGYFAPAAKR